MRGYCEGPNLYENLLLHSKASLLLPPVHTVTDVRKSMLIDLIIVSDDMNDMVHTALLSLLFGDFVCACVYCVRPVPCSVSRDGATSVMFLSINRIYVVVFTCLTY